MIDELDFGVDAVIQLLRKVMGSVSSLKFWYHVNPWMYTAKIKIFLALYMQLAVTLQQHGNTEPCRRLKLKTLPGRKSKARSLAGCRQSDNAENSRICEWSPHPTEILPVLLLHCLLHLTKRSLCDYLEIHLNFSCWDKSNLSAVQAVELHVPSRF